MKTPKYIISAIKNAKFHYGKDSVIGYSIQIHKQSEYEYARTLINRCNQIISWCNRQIEGSAEMVSCPRETHYTDQYAVITIYDPLMLHLEKYIKAATI